MLKNKNVIIITINHLSIDGNITRSSAPVELVLQLSERRPEKNIIILILTIVIIITILIILINNSDSALMIHISHIIPSL